MKCLVTGREMRLLDNRTSDCFHVPGIVLMEQAADAFVRELFSCRKGFKNVLVLCGTGNNGGDGIAIARLLNQRGVRTSVSVINPLREDSTISLGTESFRLQSDIYHAYGYPTTDFLSSGDNYDLIIDALFGTGLSREITGTFAEVIEKANRQHAIKASVDIASGVSADTGQILGIAFRADLTITFSFGKTGQYLWPGNEYSGDIHVVPMGITKESFMDDEPSLRVLEEEDLKFMLPPRKAHSNKGSYGKLLIIAGSRNMAGAAVFCAKAASRCGAGLVKVMTPEENRLILQSLVPEAILSVYDDAPSFEQVEEAMVWADAIVCGPGIGTGEDHHVLLEHLLNSCTKPLLLDADALNILSGSEKLQNLLYDCQAPVVLTPHLGEMSRLSGYPVAELQKNLPEYARVFSDQYHAALVLKDFHTVIHTQDGGSYLNLTGNNGMAAGGSGDVLSGVIGALMAAGMPVRYAAPAGVFIHGKAGDLAVSRTGYHGMNAGDLLDGLLDFWARYDNQNR